MKLQQIVYRDLLTAARDLDRNAAFRALISSNMLIRPVSGEYNRTQLPHVEEFNRVLLTYLGNRSYYLPSRERKSAQELVREKFRQESPTKHSMDTAFVALKALNDRVSYAMEIGVLENRLGKASKKTTGKKSPKKIIRDLNDAQSAREASEQMSSRVTNVRLADTLSSGIFLLSHPMLNGIFNRSVIVLTEHTSKGTKGFIVNRPTNTPLMKVFKVHPRIMRAFGSSKVRKGGPLRTEHAEILHSREEFGGERVITGNFRSPTEESLFVGVDLETAAKAVEKEEAKQTDVMFINGISSWIPGQLESEMQRGTWVAVKAPLSFAVNPEKDLWSELMGHLGGEYEAFSRMPVIHEEEFDEEDDFFDDDDEGDFEERS
ncbi:hypothetical protein Poli38472_005196 [Pythium oligandrum]|uniref:Transcriptional regulator n=1 Tax=Pythium oligandrum TaxID=41045 RepID=A0A8K1FLD9_PYTOL|nr:hypothetical protein Poli38472_005196 [Pythium oligandrum]|eukprot:TMW62578.1 hypothetical protein Poli38472_005196 [Pythium oligandrum]